MPHFTLYSHAGPGPNPLKIAILLEKLGLDFDVKALHFGDDKETGVKGAEFLKVNPNGRVPALVDHKNSDFVVWESGAILNYLCNKYDQAGKFSGASPEEKAVVDQWLMLQMTGLGPSQGNLNYYHHYWEQTYGEKPGKSVFTRFEGDCHRLYSILEAQLKKQKARGSKFIALDRPSIADLSFYPWVNIAGFGKLDLSPYPEVQEWLKTLQADGDVVKADSKLPKS